MRIVSRGQGRNAQDGSSRMTKPARNALRFALAAAAGTVCLFINDNTSLAQRSSLVSQADAKSVPPTHYGSGAGGYYGASGGAYYGGLPNPRLKRQATRNPRPQRSAFR